MGGKGTFEVKFCLNLMLLVELFNAYLLEGEGVIAFY